MFQRVLVISLWVVALAAAAVAQQVQRAGVIRNEAPAGVVYVSQRIDLSQQLGADEVIMTLDGEPPPRLETRNVTLGVIIDDDGHILTRLTGVIPGNSVPEVTVMTPRGQSFLAKFIGMDAVTGLCVLKVEKASLKAPAFAQSATLPLQRSVRLFGFHPYQGQSQKAALMLLRPRIYEFPSHIAKARSDFRYSPTNPIYYLVKPHLTPVQDGSLLLDQDDSIFGIAIYDTSGEGNNLVFPITRVRHLAQAVIRSNSSIAHGWLGATGSDLPMKITVGGTIPPVDRGVRVAAVFPDSPAELAGVKAQDVLLSISGRPVESVGQLTTALRQLPADSEVTLKVKRGGAYKLLQARLTPAPAVGSGPQINALMDRLKSMEKELEALPPADPRRHELGAKVTTMRGIMNGIFKEAPTEIRLRVFYGLEVQPLTAQLAKFFAAPGGVLVATVVENNKGAQAGLQAGDVILKIGDRKVTDFTSVLQAMEVNPQGEVEITVIRQREQLKLIFRP